MCVGFILRESRFSPSFRNILCKKLTFRSYSNDEQGVSYPNLWFWASFWPIFGAFLRNVSRNSFILGYALNHASSVRCILPKRDPSPTQGTLPTGAYPTRSPNVSRASPNFVPAGRIQTRKNTKNNEKGGGRNRPNQGVSKQWPCIGV